MVARKSKVQVSKTKTETTEAADSDLDNVDKIRDILFGNQMRDMNQKHAALEQRLASDIEKLRKETALQFESLQSFMESEIEILSNKLTTSEKEQHQQMDDLHSELNKNVKHIDKKITDIKSAMDKQSSDINQKILKQSKDFSAELNSQIEETRQRMDAFRQELSSGKVDKAILAEMLNALAIQVNSED